MSDMSGQAAEQNFRDLLHFTEALIRVMNDLAIRMGEYVRFTQAEAMKTNENHSPKIVASFEDGGLSPSISTSYLYEEYQAGTSMEDIAQKSIDFAKASHVADINFNADSLCRENAADHLYYQLISREMNTDIEAKCPCKIVTDDLIAVARWNVDLGGEPGRGSILITDKLAQHLEMTKEEIFGICQRSLEENTTFTVTGMSETMIEILRDQGAPEDYIQEMAEAIRGEQEQMYVITNEEKVDGSVAMLSDNCMATARERIGEDFYILPSSRHEILAVPMSCIQSPDQLREMVVDVNRTQVAKSDFLADNVYAYLGKTHEIVPCFDKEGKAIDITIKAAETLTQKAFEEPEIGKGRAM